MLSPDQVASQGPGGFLNLNGGATDPYYALADGSGYPNVQAACDAVPVPARKNRTVYIKDLGEHFWSESDTSNAGLKPKPGGNSFTAEQAQDAAAAALLAGAHVGISFEYDDELNRISAKVTVADPGGTPTPLYGSTGQNTDGAMTQKATTDALNGKVDKVPGKGLSTNDYTTLDKQKLDGLSQYTDPQAVDAVRVAVDESDTIEWDGLKPSVKLDSITEDKLSPAVRTKLNTIGTGGSSLGLAKGSFAYSSATPSYTLPDDAAGIWSIYNGAGLNIRFDNYEFNPPVLTVLGGAIASGDVIEFVYERAAPTTEPGNGTQLDSTPLPITLT